MGALKECRNYVDDVMIGGQILVSTKLYVLPYYVKQLRIQFCLYLVVQAPQLLRSSISPTGLVDPSETQWSVEFDRRVSFVFTIDFI